MRVAIYIRVSSTEQAQEGYSLPAQTSILRKYSESYNYTIYEMYQDAGISGKNITDRPGLINLMEDAKNNKFDAVLIWKLSRLSRSLLDLLGIVDEFNKNNIALLSYSEHFDTSTPIGKMLLQLLGSIAEFERNTIIENVKMGMNERFKQGLSKASIPFGYEYSGKNAVVNPEKAVLIKEIFTRYTSGSGIRPLVTYLNLSGYKNRNGMPWRHEVVLKMLQNEFYTGYVTTGRKDLKKSNFEKLKGTHDPIIDDELFESVQKKIKNSQMSTRTRKTDASQLFSGIVSCPICGNKLYYIEAKNRYNGFTPIYRCGASNPNRNKCKGFSLSLNKVDNIVMDRIKALINPASGDILKSENTEVNSNRETLENIEKQISDTIKVRNKYFDLFESGKVEMGAFADRVNELLQKMNQLQSEKLAIEKELKNESLDVSDVLEEIKSFIEIYEHLTPQERRDLIKTLITEVEITVDKRVSAIHLVGGFTMHL